MTKLLNNKLKFLAIFGSLIFTIVTFHSVFVIPAFAVTDLPTCGCASQPCGCSDNVCRADSVGSCSWLAVPPGVTCGDRYPVGATVPNGWDCSDPIPDLVDPGIDPVDPVLPGGCTWPTPCNCEGECVELNVCAVYSNCGPGTSPGPVPGPDPVIPIGAVPLPDTGSCPTDHPQSCNDYCIRADASCETPGGLVLPPGAIAPDPDTGCATGYEACHDYCIQVGAVCDIQTTSGPGGGAAGSLIPTVNVDSSLDETWMQTQARQMGGYIIGISLAVLIFTFPYVIYLWGTGTPDNLKKANQFLVTLLSGLLVALLASAIVKIIGSDFFGIGT